MKKINKTTKYWPFMCDILEEDFPKHKCQERGQALVMLAKIEYLLMFGEKAFKEAFKMFHNEKD